MNVENSHPDADHDDVYFGLEIEFGARAEGVEPFVGQAKPLPHPQGHDVYRGRPTGDLQHTNHGGVWSYEHIGRGVKSIEARTPDGGIPLEDIDTWYSRAVTEIEHRFNVEMEPTGISKGCPVGLHTHISPLTEGQARELYELSSQDWMPVFVSSSLASKDCDGNPLSEFPVIRERGTHFCDFSRDGLNSHYCPVNKHRSGGVGHYEWRVPEPMLPEHFELVAEFLTRFIDDPDGAAEWAREIVYDGDDRLTSFQRAQAIGDALLDDSPSKTPSTAVIEEVMFN